MKTAIALLLMTLPAMADVTKTDIKKLNDAKVSDQVVLAYIRTHAPVRMNIDDLASLKKQGVSDAVLVVLASNMKVAPIYRTVYVYRPVYHSWYYYPVRRHILIRRCR